MRDDETTILITHAREAMSRAYVPFSRFKVGAAVRCVNGRIYAGCNIENPSLSLSICAERVALIKAVSEGEREFDMMAIVADTDKLTFPCGACRQMIWEFGPEMAIVLANMGGLITKTCIRELLPRAFDFCPENRINEGRKG
ncbi:MAG: cytidine deaminase [bacterium]